MFAGLMFGSLWLFLKLESSNRALQFRYEAKRLVSRETQIRSELVFRLFEKSDASTVIDSLITGGLAEDVVIYSLAGEPIHPTGTLPPVFHGIAETELGLLIKQNMSRGIFSFSYPAGNPESLSAAEALETAVIFFRILPDAKRVVAVGRDVENAIGSYRVFPENLHRYGPLVLLSVFSVIVFATVLVMLVVYRLFYCYLIKPLNQIDNGLSSLKNQNFSHRLSIRGIRDFESISTCFNETASILESSYGEAAQREKQYRTLIENIPQKVFLKNLEGQYLSCNNAYARDLNIRVEEIEGHTDFDFFPESLAIKYRRDDKRIISTGLTETMEEQYSLNGDLVWIQTTNTPVFNRSNEIIGVLGIFFDITEMKQKENTIRDLNENLENEVQKRTEELHAAYKKMEELSVTDPLTGLSNKRQFENYVKLFLRRSRRNSTTIGILMVDIDSFKNYNDHYGHVQGDEAIKIVAECIHLTVNRPEDLSARYGGEEFVILLSDVDPDGLIHVGEKLRKMVESRKIPHELSDCSEYLTLSVGCALYSPSSSDSFESVLKKADTALYAAKDDGRNRLKVSE